MYEEELKMFHNKNIGSRESVVANSEGTFLKNLLEGYLAENPKDGFLTFQVTEETPLRGMVPVPDASITVSKQLRDSYFISKVLLTDNNGKTEPLPLPTVSARLSRTPENADTYATYNASVSKPGFLTKRIVDIPIFEGITSIQPVDLIRDIDYDAIEYKNEPEVIE